MTYNGWKNYETWAVGLWLDNDEGSYNYVRELAKEIDSENGSLSSGEIAYRVSYAVKDFVEETMPELPASLASDLLSAALSAVDWRELAEHYIADEA